MLSYEALKDKPSQLLAVTSLTSKEFERVLAKFSEAYEELYPSDLNWRGESRQRRQGGGMKGALAKLEDKLLFILMYQKVYAIQVAHGLQFGLSQPQTNAWIQQLLPVLQKALAKLDMTPERDGSKLAESVSKTIPPDLQIDGTDRPRQRPKDSDAQKAVYSGKHKTHTDKNVLLINEHTSQVEFLSATQPGSMHDKKVADEANIVYPPDATLTKDTGFQGYEPENINTYQPKKNRKASRSATMIVCSTALSPRSASKLSTLSLVSSAAASSKISFATPYPACLMS